MSYDNQHDYDQSFRAQAEEAMRAEMMENAGMHYSNLYKKFYARFTGNLTIDL